MAITAPPQTGAGKAPVGEAPSKAAAETGGGGTERPGFDLGGANDSDAATGDDVSPPGSTVVPGGPKGAGPASDERGGPRGAPGMSQGGDQTVGGPASGSRPGEATTAAPGVVRPPQGAGSHQGFAQGNPDDAT